MAGVITVPDYTFSGFYYPEILRSLQEYRRVNAPELTSESAYEPHIQLERAFSLVGHLNNTRVDIIANENLLDSLTLRESMKRLFRLIGYKLKSAAPATAIEVIRLSSVSNVNQVAYVPAYSQFATDVEQGDEVTFEATSDKPMDRTDEISHVFGKEYLTSGSDGVVDTAFPNRFTSASVTFTAADVGRYMAILVSANGNAFDELVITNFIDSNTVEVGGVTFISETDLVFAIYEYTADFATYANDEVNTFQPWTSPDGSDTLLIGHNHIHFDQIDFTLIVGNDQSSGIWEYYDPTYSRAYPTAVTDLGGNIRFEISSLVPGFTDELKSFTPGMVVKVTYNITGKSETMLSTVVSGEMRVETKGLLGQSVVDTDPLNYTVSADWVPLIEQDDGTTRFQQTGIVTYDWPFTSNRQWQKAVRNNVEAYWVRFRYTDGLPSPTTVPTFFNVKISEGTQWFTFPITQGQTILNEIIGSSNGESDQEFTSLSGPVFDDSFTLEVDEAGGGSWVPWTPVENFLNSGATDRHYKWDYDDDGKLTVKFGNGTYGRRPPSGVENIRLAEYRIGGDTDGNVGVDQITSNVDGVNYVGALGNPMEATGWTIREAGDEADLERMKDVGPASIRNDGKAVSPSDIPLVAVNEYRTSDGSALIERAYAVEEAYGPKTVQLVVVGNGGNFLSEEQLGNVDTYFNGDRYSVPPVVGVLLLNSELTTVNYDPRSVDVTVTVYGTGITVNQIVNAISAYLDPLATDENGDYVHDFGGLFAVVMLDCAISDISSGIKNIVRTSPAADINLGPRQLPIPGTINVTIVSA